MNFHIFLYFGNYFLFAIIKIKNEKYIFISINRHLLQIMDRI